MMYIERAPPRDPTRSCKSGVRGQSDDERDEGKFQVYDSTTTKVIDYEKAPNESEDGLDDTEDTGSEETSASTSDTDRTEESRRVVVDGVDSATSSALVTKPSRIR